MAVKSKRCPVDRGQVAPQHCWALVSRREKSEWQGWEDVYGYRCTIIGASGSIQVRKAAADPLEGEVLFSKVGADGKEVMEP